MNIFVWGEQYNSVGNVYTVKKHGEQQQYNLKPTHWKTLCAIQKAFNNKVGLITLILGFNLMQIGEWIYKPLKNHVFNRNVQEKVCLFVF